MEKEKSTQYTMSDLSLVDKSTQYTASSFENKEYILFVGEEANFQSRIMLIPFKEFLAVRSEEYQLLKTHSKKNVTFKIDDETHLIDNLLTYKIIWHYNEDGRRTWGEDEKTEYYEFCSELTSYADGLLILEPDDSPTGERYYLDEKDKVWYDKAIINIALGFNHIKNFDKIRHLNYYNGKPVNIVDGFLYVEERTLKSCPPYDTLQEMLSDYITKK